MKEFEKAIGLILRELRKEKHLSQTELARTIDKSPNWLSDVEHGKISIYFTDIKGLCDYLEVDIDDFAKRCKEQEKRLIAYAELFEKAKKSK